MKSILVIDVTMTGDGKHLCDKCPIWNDNLHFCQFDLKAGHKGCPLKPLPERRQDIEEATLDAMFNDGWNACIGELEEDK